MESTADPGCSEALLPNRPPQETTQKWGFLHLTLLLPGSWGMRMDDCWKAMPASVSLFALATHRCSSTHGQAGTQSPGKRA